MATECKSNHTHLDDWLASYGQCSSDVSCCRVKERTKDELYCIISLHPIIIHCHVSVETWASVDIKTGAGVRVGGSVSSIYNVSYAQTVESVLVTSRHPETQSCIHFSINVGCLYRHMCALCVNLLVAYVKVRPDLIDMSCRSSVCQQELLQLWDRRRFVRWIPERHTGKHTQAKSTYKAFTLLNYKVPLSLLPFLTIFLSQWPHNHRLSKQTHINLFPLWMNLPHFKTVQTLLLPCLLLFLCKDLHPHDCFL